MAVGRRSRLERWEQASLDRRRTRSFNSSLPAHPDLPLDSPSATDIDIRETQKVLVSPRPPMAQSIRSTSAVPNFSRVIPKTQSVASNTDHGDLSLELPAIRKSASKMQGIKRWNGQTRTFSDWDGLRRVSPSP